MKSSAIKPANAMGYKADSVDGFLCTMNNCEDNCCRNTTWKITVDTETYEKYKTLEDSKLGEHILSCIDEKDGTYYFKEFDHGHCPLLAANGLCSIHRDLGPNYLCKTCTTYPRVWNVFNGNMEYWLSISCPDVIRWVLYRKKFINYMKFPVVTEAVIPEPTPLEAEKGIVREFLIKISQFRRFTLKEKIIYMGLFMRSLSKAPQENDPARAKFIGDIINMYRDNMKKKNILEGLQSDLSLMDSEKRNSIFYVLTTAVTKSTKSPKTIPAGIKNSKYYALLTAMLLEAHATKDRTPTIEAFDRLIVPYVNENAYVFENYLTYVIVSSAFLNDAEDYAKAYAGFAGELLSMLVYCAGLLKRKDILSHDEMIAGMYLFHRQVSHNKELRKNLSAVFSNDLLNLLLGALGGIE
jgi:lysine-N-methylase